MSLTALTTFIQTQTTAEELASLARGRGLYLPPEAGAELSALTASGTAASATANVVAVKNLIPAAGDLFHAAVLALVCGTLVEKGADPGAAIDTTLDLFVRQLDALATDPDELNRAASQLIFMATMTMLCRSPETRKLWRLRPEVMTRLEELEEDDLVPSFLREVFTLHDDLDLLVLDAKNRRVFSFRTIAVRDRLYHLYALLQDALLRHAGPGYLDAEPVDAAAVRYAQNRDLTQEDYAGSGDLHDHLRFNFAIPGALFMPGSAAPDGLPRLDGVPFLLVEPKLMTVGWSPANMYPVVHEALKATVELVRELDRDEAETLLGRCGIVPVGD